MYQVYVLKSLKSSKQYVGISSQDLEEKLKEHNQGATNWTRLHKPFELIYFEKLNSKTEALKREKYFKTGQGRRTLDNLLSKFAPEGMAQKNL